MIGASGFQGVVSRHKKTPIDGRAGKICVGVIAAMTLLVLPWEGWGLDVRQLCTSCSRAEFRNNVSDVCPLREC